MAQFVNETGFMTHDARKCEFGSAQLEDESTNHGLEVLMMHEFGDQSRNETGNASMKVEIDVMNVHLTMKILRNVGIVLGIKPKKSSK